MDIYDRALWANPDNYYHDEYRLAWMRRFWVAFTTLTVGAGVFVPGMAWLIVFVPAVLLAIGAFVLCLVVLAAALLSWLPGLANWLNGR